MVVWELGHENWAKRGKPGLFGRQGNLIRVLLVLVSGGKKRDGWALRDSSKIKKVAGAVDDSQEIKHSEPFQLHSTPVEHHRSWPVSYDFSPFVALRTSPEIVIDSYRHDKLR